MMKINLFNNTSINSVHCVSPEIGRAHRELHNISKFVLENIYNASCLFIVTEFMAQW